MKTAASWSLPVLFLTLLSVSAGCSDKSKSNKEETSDTADENTKQSPPRETTGPTTPGKGGQLAELAEDSGAHEGKATWALKLGDVGSDAVRAVAPTGENEFVVAGYSNKKTGFGPAAGTDVDGTEAFVAKFADRKLVWGKYFGGVGADIAEAIAVDEKGRIGVAGSFSDELKIGEETLKATGADDAFVALFEPDGTLSWAKRLGGGDVDASHYLAFGPSGDLLVTGVFRLSARFGEIELKSAGDGDIFVAALAPESGDIRWAKRYGGAGMDAGRAVAVDREGATILLAEFSRSVPFGSKTLESTSNRDMALVKFARDGKTAWAGSYGNEFDVLAFDMAVDQAGNITVAGGFEYEMEITGPALSSAGKLDPFIARFKPDGTPAWSTSFGSKYDDAATSVVADKAGNVYVSGHFFSTFSIGEMEIKSNGKRDVFVAKLDRSGKFLWVRSYGGPEKDSTRGLALSADGGAIMTGAFHRTAEFGENKLTAAADPKALIPTSDAFVLQISR